MRRSKEHSVMMLKVENVTGNSVRIPRHAIEMLSTDKCHTVEIYIE